MSGITFNMEFVVLVSVFAITLTQVVARPADTQDDSKTKDGSAQLSKAKVFEFKLPTKLSTNYNITIKGTLNMQHDTFTALLPFEGGDEDSHCRIVYDYKKETVLVSPPANDQSRASYQIEKSNITDRHFSLTFRPKRNVIGINFEERITRQADWVYCSIKSVNNFGSIRFEEGVKNINSISFTFDSKDGKH